MRRPLNRTRPRAGILAVALVAAMAISIPPAHAAPSCIFTEGIATVVLDGDDQTLHMVRTETGEIVFTVDSTPVSCVEVNPTVTNTDLIVVDVAGAGIDGDGTDHQSVIVDLSGGDFAPSAGGAEDDEVSFDVDLGETGEDLDLLQIIGSEGPDAITVGGSHEAGTTLVALNVDTDSEVGATGVEDLLVWGDAGNDTLSGAGGNGTGSPYTGPMLLDGGDGDDTLTGGSAGDTFFSFATAADGADSMNGGDGGDQVDYCYRTTPTAGDADGIADDGEISPAELDNIGIDVEEIALPNGPGCPAPPPTNDNFVDAVQVTGTSGSIGGTNVGATAEGPEPSGSKTVWYDWSAPSTGTFSFYTSGSTFDPTLAIYTGADSDGLTLVGADDDSAGGGEAVVTFSATQETLYSIAIDGDQGAEGSFTMNWQPGTFTQPPPPPPPPPPSPPPSPERVPSNAVVTDPSGDPMTAEQCAGATLCGSTGDDQFGLEDGSAVGGAGKDIFEVTITDQTTTIDASGGGGNDVFVLRISDPTNEVDVLLDGGCGADRISIPDDPGNVSVVIEAGCSNDDVSTYAAPVSPRRSAQFQATGRLGGYKIDGGRGNDTVESGLTDDRIRGGLGHDLLWGRRGSDRLRGGTGHDRLAGGKGTNRLGAGLGTDACVSGSRTDTFGSCETIERTYRRNH